MINEKIALGLEEVAHLAKSSNDAAKIKEAISAVKELISGKDPFQQLDTELATWQSKLSVILKEPVGREGMVKHARYWAEKIKNAG